ncbi:MAG: hypothetical protein NE327_05660 [Lentisphaeraceae bacterium]|nr:hypothetical protein [Lentisphaeraceae bacterium]
MKVLIIMLLLVGCSNEELKQTQKENRELKESIRSLTNENEKITKDLNTYKEFFESKKVGVLTKSEIDFCKKIAAELNVNETPNTIKPIPNQYFKVFSSIAKSCSAVNFDSDIIYDKNNVLKGIERNSASKAFELVLAAQNTLKSVNPSNYDILVCLDVIMSAYSRFHKNATTSQIKGSLDLWINKISQLGKTLSISQSMQFGSMIVYFEVLEQ